MECIEFKYGFRDEDNECKEVKLSKRNETIHDYDVCEMFLDFMRSVGFSEENIFRYFKE